MALLKTIEEIKEVLPKLVSNLNGKSKPPNFDATEEKYLVPLIGNALYEDLVAKYGANTLSDDEKLLVKHMRLVIAAYGFSDEQAATHVFFTDQGIRVNSTGDMQKAVGWEYKELKRYLQDRALDGTEVLLSYLWKKKAALPLWTASDAFKQFEGLLIRTGADFDSQYKLYQPMRTFYAMKSILADVQEDYLEAAMGEDLLSYFTKLQNPTTQEIRILKHLKKALAFLTVNRYCEHNPVRFGDSGFTVVASYGGDPESEDAGRSAASPQLVEKKMKACEREGTSALAKAKNELVKYRKDPAVTQPFVSAFDKGPLTKYVDPAEQTSGNEKHKFFRF